MAAIAALNGNRRLCADKGMDGTHEAVFSTFVLTIMQADSGRLPLLLLVNVNHFGNGKQKVWPLQTGCFKLR